MNVWPGHPFPLGPMWDGEGTNFSIFSENERVQLCLFDRDDTETFVGSPSAPPGTGTATYRGSAPAALRLPRPRRCAGAGHRFNPASCSSTPTPRRSRADPPWRALPYVPNGSGDADLHIDGRRRSRVPKSIVVDETFDWEGDGGAGRACPGTRPSSTRCTSRASQRHPGARRSARHLCRARVGAVDRAPEVARRDDGRLLPVHHIADEQFLAERGLTNWGYSSSASSPRMRLRRERHEGASRCRVQGHGEGAACRGPRGELSRRRLQPPARATTSARCCRSGRRRASYYRLVPDDRRFCGLTREPATASTPRRSAAADHGLAAVLRHGCHVDGFHTSRRRSRASSTTSTASPRSRSSTRPGARRSS